MKAHLSMRIIFLFSHVILASLISHFALNDQVLPDKTYQSYWLWTVYASVLFTWIIDQAFFTDAMGAASNGIVVFLASYLVLNPVAEFQRDNVEFFWYLLGIAAGILAVVALLGTLLSRLDNKLIHIFSELCKEISTKFASPIPLFTAWLLLSVYSFNTRSEEVFWALFMWIIVILNPLDEINEWRKKIWPKLEKAIPRKNLGTLIARREPDIVEILLNDSQAPRIGSLVGLVLQDQKAELAVALSPYRLVDETRLRAMVFGTPFLRQRIDGLRGRIGDIVLFTDAEGVDKKLLSFPVYQNREQLTGIVVERSDLDQAIVELLHNNTGFEVGDLLQIPVDTKSVLYQIIGGVTDSEGIVQRNRHGFNRAIASKIGIWNNITEEFERIQWLPEMNAPAFAFQEKETNEKSAKQAKDQSTLLRYVGRIPKTSYGVEVDTSTLVTHNTAILGALGTGKTSLAVELVDRMIRDGIKCVVLDITGEYQQKLSQLGHYCAEKNDECINSLPATLTDSNTSNPRIFMDSFSTGLEQFMGDADWKLLIVNPTSFRLRVPHRFGRNRPPVDYTPAMFTALFATVMLERCRTTFVDRAQLCLVLEEGHTLVPEFHAIVGDEEKLAVSATSRAILQGRKHGLGTLVISQRTALITKSILNQCNTVFALRAYDATGEDFLNNYVGKSYTQAISTLEDQQCIVFGKGIRNADVPLLIKLNDRDGYLTARANVISDGSELASEE